MTPDEPQDHPEPVPGSLRPWRSLSEAEQLALRMAYQEALDKEPLTCSLETKVERFARWLAERGVEFGRGDL